MSGIDRLTPSGLRGLTRPRITAGHSQAELYRRRRGALALAALAVLSLMIGLAAGAGSGGTPVRRGAALGTQSSAQIRTLAGTGPDSFASSERAAEAAAINRTLGYTPYVRVAGSQHREIALTFDDGPGPYTPAILSALEREHAPATFFEVGMLERYFHASTSAIVARRYPIGDHGQSHAAMSRLSMRDQQSELLHDAAAIGTFGAPFPRLFRPPYGLWNATTLKLLKRYRMLMVLWTVDTADYQSPGVEAIVHSAVRGARPGAIILMHDAGGNRAETVAALPIIIRELRRRGYRLVTIPRLLLDNPAPAVQPVASLQGAGG
ncbi:MAG: polysaccharide deacetylase family protein [Candidatus Dormibacteria bacterium]